MRIDAERNRERVVTAARELIARDGAAVTMDDVARRAGVAVGTIYRHFPTKAALVADVVAWTVERIADRVERSADRVDAGAPAAVELAETFRAIAADHPVDRAVKVAAAALGVPVEAEVPVEASAEGSAAAVRASTALNRLLEAARAESAVDARVTVNDLAMMLAQLPDGPAVRRERYVEIALAGLTRDGRDEARTS